jgi:hypothetical protein
VSAPSATSCVPAVSCVLCDLPAAVTPPANTVQVTCTKQTGASWPEGGFTVSVKAQAAAGTAAGLTGCDSESTLDTVVTVNKLPEVSVESPPAWATVTGSGTSAPTVCSSDNQLNFNYTVTTGTSGLPYTLLTDRNYCTVTPSTSQGES